MDRELLKIASNFSIAGAVLVTAATIAGKDLSPVVNTTTKSGTPSTINVRVVDMPKLTHSKLQVGEVDLNPVEVDLSRVEVDVKNGPENGLMVTGYSRLGGSDALIKNPIEMKVVN